MGIHGGDVYRNYVDIDFSTNVNPLGMPDAVRAALYKAIQTCGRYPDIQSEKLRKAVSKLLAVPEDDLLFGNGASELFMAIVHGIKVKKAVIPVPSFYGYEYAAKAVESKIIYYEMNKKNGFCLTDDCYRVLTDDVDVLFIANPNNPIGNLLSREAVKSLLRYCRDKGIYVVLDECFIEFCGNHFSMLSETEEFDNLILVRAFTKIFSIPGVRLGYLLCKNQSLRTKIASQLPEWNLSCFAQEAGCICAEQTEYVIKTVEYTRKERNFLEDELKRKGFQVFPSMANFIMIYSESPLYESLLEKGILIRDCRNFRGLGRGFYRIAVKSRKENELLLENM